MRKWDIFHDYIESTGKFFFKNLFFKKKKEKKNKERKKRKREKD